VQATAAAAAAVYKTLKLVWKSVGVLTGLFYLAIRVFYSAAALCFVFQRWDHTHL
jgi:hypothetical protein